MHIHNDRESQNLTFKLLTDDVKLYSSLNTNFNQSRLQKAINSVVALSITWKLPINYLKCSSFHAGAKNQLYSYYLNSIPVSITNSPRAIRV